MILWMMLGHVGASRLGYIVPDLIVFLRRIFFFFMPWFFYKSGMFRKPQGVRIIGGGKLLKPFAMWSIIGLVVYTICQIVWGEAPLYKLLFLKQVKAVLFQNLVLCNEPLWFLLTLFIVINIGNILMNMIHPLIISLIGIALGYAIYLLHNEYIPDIIANSATGLCFFSLGYWMQGKENNKYTIVVALVGFLISVILLHSPFVDMRTNTCLGDRAGWNYLFWFPASWSGIIVLNNVCSKLSNFFHFKVIRFIGRNAMSFYVTHYIILYAIGYILNYCFHVTNGNILWLKTFIYGLAAMGLESIYIWTKEYKFYKQ